MLDPRKTRTWTRFAGIALAVAASVAAISAAAEDSAANRYPYDPACPWGRIANGKGLLVRCMTEAESHALLSGNVGAKPAQTASPNATSSAAPSGAAAPAANADDKDKDKDDEKETADEGADKLSVNVDPPVADKGKLATGKLALNGAKAKYRRCVLDNGGLEGDGAEVTVRFLVRERGRAEGVSVAKRKGMSAKAAQCVAEVVDRRQAGVPEVPLTGASVAIKFSKQ